VVVGTSPETVQPVRFGVFSIERLHMSVRRLRVGLAVSFLGLALTTGTAAAQVGCVYPQSCTGETTTTTAPPSTTTTTVEVPGGNVLGENLTADTPAATGAPGSVEASSATAPSGSLPFTGGDVAGLVVIGAVAVGAGTLMIRRSRTQH
jgi:hypothetical protein